MAGGHVWSRRSRARLFREHGAPAAAEIRKLPAKVRNLTTAKESVDCALAERNVAGEGADRSNTGIPDAAFSDQAPSPDRAGCLDARVHKAPKTA
jgi:hypothetical protein